MSGSDVLVVGPRTWTARLAAKIHSNCGSFSSCHRSICLSLLATRVERRLLIERSGLEDFTPAKHPPLFLDPLGIVLVPRSNVAAKRRRQVRDARTCPPPDQPQKRPYRWMFSHSISAPKSGRVKSRMRDSWRAAIYGWGCCCQHPGQDNCKSSSRRSPARYRREQRQGLGRYVPGKIPSSLPQDTESAQTIGGPPEPESLWATTHRALPCGKVNGRQTQPPSRCKRFTATIRWLGFTCESQTID